MRVPCKFSRKKKRKKTLWRSARNHLFPCWCLSRRTQMSEKLYISLQQGRCRLSGGVELGRERGREGWVGGWVLSHLLALLAVYPHGLAILLCKLCIQGFAVHVRTVRAHTNTGSYLCPSPRAGYLHQNEMKWEMKLESECLSESFFFFFHPSCADVPHAILWRWVGAFFTPRGADCLLRSAAFHVEKRSWKTRRQVFYLRWEMQRLSRIVRMEVQFAKWFKLLNCFFCVCHFWWNENGSDMKT